MRHYDIRYAGSEPLCQMLASGFLYRYIIKFFVLLVLSLTLTTGYKMPYFSFIIYLVKVGGGCLHGNSNTGENHEFSVDYMQILNESADSFVFMSC